MNLLVKLAIYMLLNYTFDTALTMPILDKVQHDEIVTTTKGDSLKMKDNSLNILRYRRQDPVVQPDWTSDYEIGNLFKDLNVRVTHEKLEETEAIRDLIQTTVEDGTYAVDLDKSDFEEDKTDSESESEDAEEPDGRAEPEPVDEHIPKSELEPVDEPIPKSELEPAHVPVPESKPEPAHVPVPESEPEPVHEPVPEYKPEPALNPKLHPVLVPKPKADREIKNEPQSPYIRSKSSKKSNKDVKKISFASPFLGWFRKTFAFPWRQGKN